MAQTMLYVNEHAHDELWDKPVSSDSIRSFRPEDYPVLTAGDGTIVVVSGHPAERGTFDFFVAAMENPALLDDPRFKTVEKRLENFDQLIILLQAWAMSVSTVDELESRLAKHKLAMDNYAMCVRLRKLIGLNNEMHLLKLVIVAQEK